MEILQQFSPLFPSFNHLPINLLLSILQFLDYDSKMQIKNYTSKNQNTKEFFIHLLSMSLFIEKYLNATDRSVYFPIYAEQAYRRYQKQIMSQLCVHNVENYLKLQKSLEKIFQSIGQQLSSFNSKNELIQSLEAIIRDPFIPLPKMRKEGIAMHCNSSLQYALVDLYFQPGQQEEMFLQQWAVQLEQFLLQSRPQIQARLDQQIKERRRKKSIIKIMKEAYYHPQLINTDNYSDYLIQQITPFNLFIYMHALVSGIAQIYNLYILDQGKDFEKFIEYELRFAIFRSIILNIEQSYLSKTLYQNVETLIQKAQVTLNNSYLNCNEMKRDSAILEVDVQLENKKSGEQQYQNIDFLIPNNLSRISSQIKTQKTQRSDDLYQQIHFQMRSRLYIAGGKMWANQSRRVKQNYDQYISPSKQNNYSSICQQTVNNRCYIKILNRLLQSFLIEKVQQQIKSRSQLKPIREIQQANVRDQDIINIFGNSNSEQQISSPTFSHSSYHSNYSHQSPKSPQKSYCFTKMVDRLQDLQKNSIQFAIYRSLQNTIQLRPYKYESQKLPQQNEKFSNSPEKQKQASQCYLQNLEKKTPKNTKLLSKTSMLSKFSKITETRLMSSVEELFTMNEGNQQQILLQYHSHLIDLSVNQFNVHWCGHSTQILMGQYYQHFEEGVISYCEGLMVYILKMIEGVDKKTNQNYSNFKIQGRQNMQIKANITKKIFQWLLEYLDTGYIAKKTLKKLCSLANAIIQGLRVKYNLESQFKPIDLNLEQIDKMIEHYNEKMWKIDKNPPLQILKIYELRKSARNIIQVLKCAQTENQEQKNKRKKEKKRRNSEQVLVVHNIE